MVEFCAFDSLGVPPAQMQPGSRFPLQVLGWITSLRAFRCNRSRGYSSLRIETLHY
jgi:hypothetical protein